jgi:hypothetical protein
MTHAVTYSSTAAIDDQTELAPSAPPEDPAVARARAKLQEAEQRILTEQAVERRRNAILDSLNQCKRELAGLPSDEAMGAAIEAEVTKYANLQFLWKSGTGNPCWRPEETVFDIAKLDVEARALPLLREKLTKHIESLEGELAGLSK